MLGGAVQTLVNTMIPDANFAKTETFQNGSGMMFSPGRAALVSFLTMVVMFLLILLLGKWLWNTVVVDLIGFAKPARSFWQILGLMIFMSLIRP
jgi:hypothetical protein